MIPTIPIHAIAAAIETGWSAETSYDPAEWTPDNAARGQCVVSSLILQDYLGGDIRRYKAYYRGDEESHFCNVLPDGDELDITGKQYPAEIILREAPMLLHGYATVRERLLGDIRNLRKYEILKSTVVHLLAEKCMDSAAGQ